jgi:hypothetical protein
VPLENIAAKKCVLCEGLMELKDRNGNEQGFRKELPLDHTV